MKRIFGFLTVAAFAGMLFAANAFAQSSGSSNFAFCQNGSCGPGMGNTTTCVLNNNGTGQITGGAQCHNNLTTFTACTTVGNCPVQDGFESICSGAIPCQQNADCPVVGGVNLICTGGFCTGTGVCGEVCGPTAPGCPGQAFCTCPKGAGQCVGSEDVTIKTSSGNGNVFDVRDAAVIGLLTDVTLTSGGKTSTGISSASALAGVDFQVTLTSQPAKSSATVIPNYPITYDARFIQISTNLFNALTTACVSGSVVPGFGCFFSFNESTVSAHSYDWIIAPLTSGVYDINAQWTSSLGDFGIAESLTCVGANNLTVQQNKIFEPSEGSPGSVAF